MTRYPLAAAIEQEVATARYQSQPLLNRLSPGVSPRASTLRYVTGAHVTATARLGDSAARQEFIGRTERLATEWRVRAACGERV